MTPGATEESVPMTSLQNSVMRTGWHCQCRDLSARRCTFHSEGLCRSEPRDPTDEGSKVDAQKSPLTRHFGKMMDTFPATAGLALCRPVRILSPNSSPSEHFHKPYPNFGAPSALICSERTFESQVKPKTAHTTHPQNPGRCQAGLGAGPQPSIMTSGSLRLGLSGRQPSGA